MTLTTAAYEHMRAEERHADDRATFTNLALALIANMPFDPAVRRLQSLASDMEDRGR